MAQGSDRWDYLSYYERKYLKVAIEAYDKIIEDTDDIPNISQQYQLDIEEVKRAKNYAFGDGVCTWGFTPDLWMAQAWQRLATGEGNECDELLLKHEVFESNLVINQSMTVQDAHLLAQARYPWSLRLLEWRTQNHESTP